MTKMKKGDFIELDFIGRIKSSNEIFDLTSEEEAKKNNLYSENYKYGSVIICIGQGQILKYIDDGHNVIKIVFSSGEKSQPHFQEDVIIKRRIRETLRIGKDIGLRDVIFLNLKDMI